MSYYEYIEGRLVKQEDPLGFCDGEEWPDCLRRNGFRADPIIEYGVSDGSPLCMSVCEKHLNDDEWLIEIVVDTTCYLVSIKGLEGFLKFKKEYRPLFRSFCE
jgi:hypothetical protein